MSNLFDDTAYYVMSCDLYGSGYTLNDAYNPSVPGSLFLGNISYSSQNWQVFFQDNIYFLRNYDYGSAYQLGIGDVSASQPQLLLASGELAQQWNITIWPDGTKKLTNVAVGGNQYLGVSNTSDGSIIPVMNTAQGGSHWTFDINVSAGKASAAILPSISSITVSVYFPYRELLLTMMWTVTSTTQPTASTAATISTSTSTISKSTSPVSSTTSPVPSSTSPVSSSTSPVSGSTSSSSKSSGSTVSAGAIAGIVIAGVAVLAFIVLASIFLFRKRKRNDSPSYEDLPAPEPRAPGSSSPPYAPPFYLVAPEKTHEMKGSSPPLEVFTPQRSSTRVSELP